MNQLRMLLYGVLLIVVYYPVLAQRPVIKYGDLYVEGKYLKSANTGENVTLRSLSLGWSNWQGRFWTAATIDRLVEEWQPDLIRASIAVEKEKGYLAGDRWREDTRQKLFAVVDACIANDVYVMIDWHAHEMKQSEAKAFFREMAEKYGDYPHVIYETFNEPVGEPKYTWSRLKSYHQDILGAIRASDPDNVVICGTPRWSSATDDVCGNAVTGTNIMYTHHYYAASHDRHFALVEAAIDCDLPVFITECGGMNYAGEGAIDYPAWQRWIKLCEENDISYAYWSFSSKERSASGQVPSADMVYGNDVSAIGPWTYSEGPSGSFKEWGLAVYRELTSWAQSGESHYCDNCPKADDGSPQDPDPEEDPTDETDSTANLLTNGDFADGLEGWDFLAQGTASNASVADGEADFDVISGGPAYKPQLVQAIALEAGQTYTLSFVAKASSAREIIVEVNRGGTPDWSKALTKKVQLKTSEEAFQFTFMSDFSDATGRLDFNFGGDNSSVTLSQIELLRGTPQDTGDEEDPEDPPADEEEGGLIVEGEDMALDRMEAAPFSAASGGQAIVLPGSNSVGFASFTYRGSATDRMTVNAVDLSSTGYLKLRVNGSGFLKTWTLGDNDGEMKSLVYQGLRIQEGDWVELKVLSNNAMAIDRVIFGTVDPSDDPPAEEEEPVTGNLLVNGDFSQDMDSWGFFDQGTGASMRVSGDVAEIEVRDGGAVWKPQLVQAGFAIREGATYRASFDARAAAARAIVLDINEGPPAYGTLMRESVTLSTAMQTYSFEFTASRSDDNARFDFNLGGSDTDVSIDNVALVLLSEPDDGDPSDPGGGNMGVKPKFYIVSDIKIGRSDPDDHHAIIHLLHYANDLNIVGFSTGGNNTDGGRPAINNCIGAYEQDRNANRAAFDAMGYPSPASLRAVNFDTDAQDLRGLKAAINDGTDEPVYVGLWGQIENLQRLMDGLTSAERAKVRLLMIGTYRLDPVVSNNLRDCRKRNWNSLGGQRDHIFNNYPEVWMIEMDWTFWGLQLRSNLTTSNSPRQKALMDDMDRYGGRMGDYLKGLWKDTERMEYNDGLTTVYLIDPADNDDPTAKEGWAGRFTRPFTNRPYWIGYDGGHPWNYADVCQHWQAQAVNVFKARVKSVYDKVDLMNSDLIDRTKKLHGHLPALRLSSTEFEQEMGSEGLVLSIDHDSLASSFEGISDLFDPEGLKVYPNPAVDELRVQIGESASGEAFIFDAAGRAWLQLPLRPGTTVVPIGQLPQGFYLLRSVIDGEVNSRSFVVQ
ncbi:MAG: cellulase family glycosylhydrolase [Bacteroidota bacterium]